MSIRSDRVARAALLPLALLLATAACSEGGAAATPAAVAAPAAPAAVTAAAAQAAPQDMQQSQNTQLIHFAAGMHALSEACGGNSAAELAKMKSDGRAAFVARGMDATTYDATFAAGYAEAKAKLAAASPQERAKGCAQIESLPKPPAAR